MQLPTIHATADTLLTTRLDRAIDNKTKPPGSMAAFESAQVSEKPA